MAGTKGTLVTHLGIAVEVEIDGERRRVGVPRSSGFVVGDEVELLDNRVTLLPRRTALKRRSAAGGVQVVAANLDVLLVVAAVDPPSKVGLVDRASVAARSAGVVPALVVNKADLPDPHRVVETLRARAGGEMEVFVASAATGVGIEAIRAFLAARGRGAFVGPSGVGKSSLLNTLVPGLDLATRALSRATGAGQHTTSASLLVKLPGGGEIVDTPGVRQYGLVDIGPTELAAYFPGFEALVTGCRFRDCLHEAEPGCVIQQAVDDGRVSAERYAAYRALLEETKLG